ncbi:MAG TPA: hypothetical protein VMJ66_15870 [Geobacteraceae bacterium]|nr:hypothetical protein [Geobacteraceae bacterium]
MNCEIEAHKKHVCYLKSHGMEECIAGMTDNPKVICRQCGVKANDVQFLCAAHLLDEAPNVEGGHGRVDLDEVGKPHSG